MEKEVLDVWQAKVNIDKETNNYWMIAFNGFGNHPKLAEKIGLKPQEYVDAMEKQFGAKIGNRTCSTPFPCFMTKEQAQEAINKFIQPRIVAYELRG